MLTRAAGVLLLMLRLRRPVTASQAEWQKYLPDEPYRKTCEQWEAGK